MNCHLKGGNDQGVKKGGWSEVMSADVRDRFKQEGIFNVRVLGILLNFFISGGVCDPKKHLFNFVADR